MLFQETYKFINGKDHKNWVDRKRKERISSLLRLPRWAGEAECFLERYLFAPLF